MLEDLFVERSSTRQMELGLEIPRARTRASPAKCVFILHFLHQKRLSCCHTIGCKKRVNFPESFTGGGDFKRMAEGVKDVKDKNTIVQ